MRNKSLSFKKDKLGLIAGPCVIENEEHAVFMAKSIKRICDRVKIDVVYKSSFDKANRTSDKSFRGLGIDDGLSILSNVKKETGLSIITDIHEKSQASILSGGRYDNLISHIGGPDTPAAGFGSGIERIMISMDESFFEVDEFPHLTIISLTSEAWVKTNTLANTLREKNIVVLNASANKSFKSQMRYANQIKSKFLMVVGENELNNDEIEIKELSSGITTKMKFNVDEIYSKLIENG